MSEQRLRAREVAGSVMPLQEAVASWEAAATFATQARGGGLSAFTSRGAPGSSGLQVLIAPGLVSAQITHTSSAIPTSDQTG
jgi:hypothetical protein